MTHWFFSAVGILGGWPAYLLVSTLVFGETALLLGFVLPGETALLLGGVVAGEGRASLSVMICLGVGFAIAGDSVGFEIGRRMGPRLRAGWLGRRLGVERWRRGEELIHRLGGKAVLAARFTAFARAVVPTLAGAGRMPYRVFLPWNAAGGTIWAAGAVLLGYAAGNSLATFSGFLRWSWLPLAAVIVIIVLRRRHQTGEPLQAADPAEGEPSEPAECETPL
jgi:membrane-associated protein